MDENKYKLKKDSAMHIGTIDSKWLTSKNYLDTKVIEFIKKFSYLKSKPKDAIDNWINKELILDKKIFHIRGGGGWSYYTESYSTDCVKLISEYINNN